MHWPFSSMQMILLLNERDEHSQSRQQREPNCSKNKCPGNTSTRSTRLLRFSWYAPPRGFLIHDQANFHCAILISRVDQEHALDADIGIRPRYRPCGLEGQVFELGPILPLECNMYWTAQTAPFLLDPLLHDVNFDMRESSWGKTIRTSHSQATWKQPRHSSRRIASGFSRICSSASPCNDSEFERAVFPIVANETETNLG